MNMPTPCPECMEIVEFNEMVNVSGTMLCDECADKYQCDDCGDYSSEEGELTMNDDGKFCEWCFDLNHCEGEE